MLTKLASNDSLGRQLCPQCTEENERGRDRTALAVVDDFSSYVQEPRVRRGFRLFSRWRSLVFVQYLVGASLLRNFVYKLLLLMGWWIHSCEALRSWITHQDSRMPLMMIYVEILTSKQTHPVCIRLVEEVSENLPKSGRIEVQEGMFYSKFLSILFSR